MNKIKIGFIGAGLMGRGMINNLKMKYNVVVYNRTRATAESINGIQVFGSPKAAAGNTDIIFTCVSNDTALESVLFGSNGLFSGNIKNKILIDSGTTSIKMTEKIARAAKEKDLDFLDAPITGSKLGAEQGSMMFMIGGNKNIFDQVLPVLKTMGQRFVYCGPTPNGQKAKHALNMTMSLILESYLEGLALGIKNGVPPAAMQEILDNSGARNGIASFKMPYIKNHDFEEHFALRLMHKDLGLADEDRQSLGLYAPLADEITKVFAEALERGDEDICTIAKTLEEKNNIKFT